MRLRLDRYDAALVGLVLAGSFALTLVPLGPKKFGDGDFHVEAKAISLALRGAGPWTDVAVTKAVAPTLFYSIPYLTVAPGSSDEAYYRAARVWTSAWLVVSVLLIRRAAELLGGSLAGRLAPLTVFAPPFALYYSCGINAENPAHLGSTLLAVGWAAWIVTRSRWAAATSIAGLCLLVLSRPNALLIFPVALVVAALAWWTRKPERRLDARMTVVAVTVAALTFAVSIGAAQLLPGRPEAVRQGGYLSQAMFQGRFQYRTEPWDWRFWDRTTRSDSADYQRFRHLEREIYRQAEEQNVDPAMLRWKWIGRDILENPLLTLRMIGVRILALHFTFVNSRPPETFRIGSLNGHLVYYSIHTVINAVNWIILAGAVAFLIWRPGALLHWPLWGPWIALVAFHGVVYAEPRYVFPSRVGIGVMASIMAASTAHGWWSRRLPTTQVTAPAASHAPILPSAGD